MCLYVDDRVLMLRMASSFLPGRARRHPQRGCRSVAQARGVISSVWPPERGTSAGGVSSPPREEPDPDLDDRRGKTKGRPTNPVDPHTWPSGPQREHTWPGAKPIGPILAHSKLSS